jgi:hypothetical protein
MGVPIRKVPYNHGQIKASSSLTEIVVSPVRFWPSQLRNRLGDALPGGGGLL